MHIVRTFDKELVSRICKHPKIWPWICSDGVDIDTWDPPMQDLIYWLCPVHENKTIGVFMVYPITWICWEVHTNILPEYWGPSAKEAAICLIKYIFSETNCEKLITHVPENNKLALRFAIQSGMKREWVNKRSIKKNGQVLGQIVLAIYKGE